ncbi:efflux transporter outer membrane subunit [Sphingobium sp. V4]|uniref:efflux transporter outer membrane subunit n=1 Tax=Sphingobium sp. V4 TaxID=3038927 RepID=UPI0025581DDA|nr:efflux transporter outer membrane subunit [Sphingobium sp. V4]WIW87722.1 efflux transporter outer membrane subunit [Sphingobium sp. V4]
MTRNFIALLLGASALTACAAGPDYKAPATPTTAAAPFIGAATPAVVQAPADDHWWRLYNDPLLDGLVKDALSANTDIRVAVARLERARAQLRGARSDRLPGTTLSGSPTYGRVSQAQTLPGMDRENWTVDMGLDVAYEVDLFGRVKRSIEAARGDAGAAQADTDAVRVAVVADTVRAYVDATASAQRIAVAQQTVDLLDQSLRISQARFDVGRSDRLDVIRITSLRDQQKALIPSLVADRNAALFRLATLTGRTPQDLPATVRDAKVTPDLSQPIPVGDGQALLARRPDVRAAEQRLAGDTARIGVATAALYPRITLGGSIGSTAIGGGNILGGGPLNWLLGPLISWAFPNQEANRARIAAARADGDAALATFDGTVLRALEETETALSTYANALQRRAALQTARDEAARAARISTARQREGQIDFLTVLDALRTQAAADADLAAANRAVAFAQVDLFRALGGGWTAA